MHLMKRLLASLTLISFLVLPGCALLSRIKNSSAPVLLILSEAQWGVAQAHDELWVSDTDFTTIEDVLNVAVDAVNASPNGAAAVAKKILQDAEAKLATDSRLRPYFDAAIILL